MSDGVEACIYLPGECFNPSTLLIGHHAGSTRPTFETRL